MLLLTPGCGQSHDDPAAAPHTPLVGRDGKDVEWVPTPPVLVDKMLQMADVAPGDVVIDLGSGDGRTVIAAARLGADASGVEFDPDLVRMSREAATAAGVADRATFVQGDLFEADLSRATVVTMFLLPDINMKLHSTLLELAPGTRIVSNTWDMNDWMPDATEVIDPCPSWCTALLWIVPAHVEGTWQLVDGTLALQQQFQYVSGTLTRGAAAGGRDRVVLPVEAGRLRGADLTFRAGDVVFHGRVDRSRFDGTTGPADGSDRPRSHWHATRLER